MPQVPSTRLNSSAQGAQSIQPQALGGMISAARDNGVKQKVHSFKTFLRCLALSLFLTVYLSNLSTCLRPFFPLPYMFAHHHGVPLPRETDIPGGSKKTFYCPCIVELVEPTGLLPAESNVRTGPGAAGVHWGYCHSLCCLSRLWESPCSWDHAKDFASFAEH